ncbi:AlbA family DNA-binding domain-containing protein [Chryseosolibacter indicus]|nr:ATP-binding protein [Chryseosolibacter indicus]
MMNKPQEAYTFNARQVQDLKRLVLQGEGSSLEFKRKAAYPEKIVREMIAFANTKGGILLVGVGDDGSLAGLKYPEGESYVIREALKKCRPSLSFKETFIPIGNSRTIIQYEIFESTNKPHYLLNGEAKESFVRSNDQSIKASREVREIVKRAQHKKDVRFHYGEHEQFLMQYLEENPFITLKKFIELRGLKRFYASKKLVLLVLADVLKITPHERGDLYSLAFNTNTRTSR